MGLAVVWAVVRSLPDFPDADPTDVDYLGGGCLLLRARLAIGTFRYVDDDRAACADTNHRLSWREKGISRHLDSAAEAVLESSLVSLGAVPNSRRLPTVAGSAAELVRRGKA